MAEAVDERPVDPVDSGVSWRKWLHWYLVPFVLVATAALSAQTILTYHNITKLQVASIKPRLSYVRFLDRPVVEGTDLVVTYPRPTIMDGTFVEMTLVLWCSTRSKTFRVLRSIQSTTAAEEWRVPLTAFNPEPGDYWTANVHYTLKDANNVTIPRQLTGGGGWRTP